MGGDGDFNAAGGGREVAGRRRGGQVRGSRGGRRRAAPRPEGRGRSSSPRARGGKCEAAAGGRRRAPPRPGEVAAGFRRRGPEAERTGSAGAAPASCWSKDCAAARRRWLLPLPQHEGDDARVPASSRSSIANSPVFAAGSRSPLRGAASKV
uniref:Uncharacterized protein n=1 Tax=Triticum urartu TaxID=4572 RepID=A0A8R7K1K6_TRIUA